MTTSGPNRRKVPMVWTLVAAALIIAVAYWYWRQEGATAPVESITIAQAGDFFLYAPLYVAVDAGFFRQNGLDVSLVSTGGDEKTWAAVLSNDAAFGIADPTFVAVSSERGIPGKVIASIVNGVPFWGVTLDTSIAVFTSPNDLGSHSVATFPSPSTAYTLQKKMFVDAGLRPNIKEGAFGTILGMLRSKQVDIALELEPNVSQASADGARVLYSLATTYGDFAITGLTCTPETATEKPELARKVVCSIQHALDFCRSNRDSTIAILSKRFPEIKREVATKALDRVINDGIIPLNARIGEEAWDKAIALRLQVGDLKTPHPMANHVENGFADWALRNCSSK